MLPKPLALLAAWYAKPNEDTEPHVQLLFVGSCLETGMGPQGPSWRGALCFSPAESDPYFMQTKTITKFVIGVVLVLLFLINLPGMFTATPGTGETDTSFALRSATTYGLMLIAGLWLLYSGFKDKQANRGATEPRTGANHPGVGTNVGPWNFRAGRGQTALILLVLVFLFYWFTYRPQEARRECAKSSETKARQEYSYDQSNFYPEDFQKYYTACIKARGY